MSATEKNGWTIYGPPVRGRTCGSCSLCCTLVPAEIYDEIKPANTRCRFVNSRGCSVYATRPRPCAYWSCKWLFDPDSTKMRRPDQGGYVVDPMLDTILKDGQPCDIVQVWIDPKRPDSHRDHGLRDYLAVVAEKYGLAAIIRWGSTEGMILLAPCLHEGDDWLEMHTAIRDQGAIDARLAELGQRRFGHARR